MLRSIVDKIMGRTAKPSRLDTATRMWREADFSPPRREAWPPTPSVSDDLDQLAELRRIVYGDRPSKNNRDSPHHGRDINHSRGL